MDSGKKTVRKADVETEQHPHRPHPPFPHALLVARVDEHPHAGGQHVRQMHLQVQHPVVREEGVHAGGALGPLINTRGEGLEESD